MSDIQLTVERPDAVSEDARVGDYDELGADAQAQVTRVSGAGTEIQACAGNAGKLPEYDVIKYTDYIRVDVTQGER